MTARTLALATVWATFWRDVEAGGRKMQDNPGYLAIGLEPIDAALREALGKAFDAGCLSAVHGVFEVSERNN